MLDISIYEIIYHKDQKLSDPGFKEHRVTNNQPEWREFRHIIDFYRSGNHLKHDLVGLFSPKFSLKAKRTGASFLDFCHSRGSADVVFINPFPQIEYIYFNVWEQGECWHPGLMDAANKLLSASGFNIDVKNFGRQTSTEILFSNFWVGNSVFWNSYVGNFLDPIAKFLESKLGAPIFEVLNHTTYHTSRCGYLPFIVERLFSTYLSLSSDIISEHLAIEHLDPYLIHPFEKKAVAIGSKIVQTTHDLDCLRISLNRLSQITTKRGKNYFKTNIHPHSGSAINSDEAQAILKTR
jgi:hypothetical protein